MVTGIEQIKIANLARFERYWNPLRRWLHTAYSSRQHHQQKGDKPGACAAYQLVLSRWGEAKQRSVTAEKARGRMKGLGCGR